VGNDERHNVDLVSLELLTKTRTLNNRGVMRLRPVGFFEEVTRAREPSSIRYGEWVDLHVGLSPQNPYRREISVIRQSTRENNIAIPQSNERKCLRRLRNFRQCNIVPSMTNDSSGLDEQRRT
jgi:hypothetical protein